MYDYVYIIIYLMDISDGTLPHINITSLFVTRGSGAEPHC
uniref:Uncharacterized protein n=1 Tax=viral metagenome TaxID=1070528 RepID=A0A6C0HGA2_9ZZZZ